MKYKNTSAGNWRQAVKSAIALVMLLATMAYSQDNSSSDTKSDSTRIDKTHGKLDDIKVRAQSTDEITKIKSSAMTATVIDAKRYAGRFVSVDELLKRTVGVDVRRTGGVGSVSRISVRGVGGKGLKVFIDGAPISAVDGMFELDNLPIQLVDRIEVYKGIAPAYLGADALGGAINLVIIDRDIDYLETSYSVGSYGSHNGVFRFRKHWLEPGIRLGGGFVPVYAKNNYDMDISFVGPEYEGATVTRDHDQFQWLGFGLGAAFTKLWFDEIEIELEGCGYIKENQGISVPTVDTKTSNILPVIAFSMEKKHFLVDGLDFDFHAGIVPLAITHHVDTTHLYRQWNGEIDTVTIQGELDNYLPHCSHDTLKSTQERLNLSYRLNEHHTFNLNNVFQYIKSSPSDELADSILTVKSSEYPAKMLSNSLGLAWDFTFLQDRVVNQFIGKVHYINSEIYGKGLFQVDLLSGIPYQGKNDECHFGFSEAIRCRLTPSMSVKASYERAVRLPNSNELFGNGAGIGPGLDLKPETSHNFNLGVNFLEEEGLLNMPRVEAEVNGFFYDTHNKIKLEPSILMSVYKNIWHTRTLGIEGEVKADVSRWFYLTANATLQDIRDVDGYKGEITKGERVPNQPWLFANLGMEFTKYDLFSPGNTGKIFWESGYTHEFYYTWHISSRAEDLIESSFTHNIGVEYRFSDKLTFSAEVNDLFDQWKTDEYNMPLPGRTIRANVHLLLMRDAI